MDTAVEHRDTPSQPSRPHDTPLQHFGATVRQYRQQRGLTHKALATRMGIRRPSYISEIELGKRNIAVPMLLRLARALDIPVAWLLARLDTHAGFTLSATDNSLLSREIRDKVVMHDVISSLEPDDQAILLPLLGETIRQYRQQRHRTQAGLATMTGMSRSHICQIEQGNRSVSLLNLVSIATAFELPMSSLLAPMETYQTLGILPTKDTSEG